MATTETPHAPTGADLSAHRPPSALEVMKRDVIDKTSAKLREMVSKGSIVVPADYSPENALKSAWLILQTVQDRDKRPALEVVSGPSVANALLDLVVQGLNPAKKQCYFIVYGTSLTLQRSYFGDMAIVERLLPGCLIAAEVVYDGDELEYEIRDGIKVVTAHRQKLANIDDSKIAGAYCVVKAADGRVVRSEVMTMAQIRKSCSMSRQYKPADQEGIHQKFARDMALRTVVRKACKPIINASSDAALLDSVRRTDEAAAELAIEAEAAELANAVPLSIEAAEPADAGLPRPAAPEGAVEEPQGDAGQGALGDPGF
jgi:recombination protein RecT